MPKFQFNDSEPKTFEPLPPGDYVAKVTECEFTISKGNKTRGCDQMELTMEITRNGLQHKFFETLIFHESTGWKVDTFAKSFNLLIDGKPPAKGEAIDWGETMVVGLSGWVALRIEEYEKEVNGAKEKRKTNRVAVFITNKEKFAKEVLIPAEVTGEPEQGENDAF